MTGVYQISRLDGPPTMLNIISELWAPRRIKVLDGSSGDTSIEGRRASAVRKINNDTFAWWQIHESRQLKVRWIIFIAPQLKGCTNSLLR